MTQQNSAPETESKQEVKVRFPKVNIKSALVTTLAVVGGVAVVNAVKKRLTAGEDPTIEVETSEV